MDNRNQTFQYFDKRYFDLRSTHALSPLAQRIVKCIHVRSRTLYIYSQRGSHVPPWHIIIGVLSETSILLHLEAECSQPREMPPLTASTGVRSFAGALQAVPARACLLILILVPLFSTTGRGCRGLRPLPLDRCMGWMGRPGG